VRTDVPQGASVSPPLRLTERVPRHEDRRQKDGSAAVPLAALHFRLEPCGYRGVKAGGKEDHGRRTDGLDKPVGRLTGQRQRLLEQQRSTGLGGTHRQRTLNVRGNGKGDCVDGADQFVDVGEGLGSILHGQRRALRRIPAPDTDEFRPGMSRESRGMHGRRPETGADQAKTQHSREPTPESLHSPTPSGRT
jgi:hypothetical protein